MVRVSPRILDRRIRAVKEGVSILQVAQDLTTLRKKGQRWRGECPICGHGGHSDAFSVGAEVGLFHCHACGSGGDLIALVARWADYSVAEAVAWLDHTYDLGLPARPDSWFAKQDRQARLREQLQRQRESVLRRRLFKITLLPLLEGCSEAEVGAAWEDFKKLSVWAFVRPDEAARG